MTPKSPKKRDRAFNRLMNGFTASSDFDKRLLVGIYRSKRKPKKSVEAPTLGKQKGAQKNTEGPRKGF